MSLKKSRAKRWVLHCRSQLWKLYRLYCFARQSCNYGKEIFYRFFSLLMCLYMTQVLTIKSFAVKCLFMLSTLYCSISIDVVSILPYLICVAMALFCGHISIIAIISNCLLWINSFTQSGHVIILGLFPPVSTSQMSAGYSWQPLIEHEWTSQMSVTLNWAYALIRVLTKFAL